MRPAAFLRCLPLLLLSIVCLTGCGDVRRSRPISSSQSYPAVGFVDFAAVEAQNPKLAIVRGIDAALANSDRYAALRSITPVNLNVDQYVNTVSTYGSVTVDKGLEKDEDERLKSIRANLLVVLNQRFLATESLKQRALSRKLSAQAQADYETYASLLQDQAQTDAERFSLDAYRIASLTIQIAAMKLNENPPRTAPKGYWAQIQAVKEAELSSVIAAYDAKLNAVYQKRDTMMSAQKQSIDTAMLAALEQQNQSDDKARRQMLADAETRFDEQQAEVKTEDAQVFTAAQSVTAESDDDAMREIAPGFAQPEFQQAAMVSTSQLALYRDRLSQTINLETRRSIASTAKQLHITIVKQRKGIPDVTALFIEAAKNQDWKVS